MTYKIKHGTIQWKRKREEYTIFTFRGKIKNNKIVQMGELQSGIYSGNQEGIYKAEERYGIYSENDVYYRGVVRGR